MASVFRKDDQHVDKPNRVSYPKTFSKSVTTKFGQIMPVFCQPVMNGETVQLNHKHTFNFLPLVFPVQTRVRASLQYYYVRYRNLWEDWEDFQFKMKPNLVKPYIKFTRESRDSLLRVGGPLDNMGVPVVTKHNVGVKIFLDNPKIKNKNFYNPYTSLYEDFGAGVITYLSNADVMENLGSQTFWDFDDLKVSRTAPSDVAASRMVYAPYRYPIVNNSLTSVKFYDATSTEVFLLCRYVKPSEAEYSVTIQRKSSSDNTSSDDASPTTRRGRTIGATDSNRTTQQTTTQTSLGAESKYFIVRIKRTTGDPIVIDNPTGYDLVEVLGRYYVNGMTENSSVIGVNVRPSDYPKTGIHLSDVVLKDLPYANTEVDNEKTIRLDAAPLRAVEAIYNARIRHADNNPYKINGVPEYNKYLSNIDGGADTFNYPQRYANWEDDMFTTALHTPQHGDAPLVGLVNQNPTGVYVTFANDDGTKNRVRFMTNAGYQEPGAPRAVYLTSANVDTNLNNSPQVPSDGYVGQLQEAMMEAVKFGITINDFRNVNSFQRWLENNVRKGYKYRDQIKSHFGVSVRYDVLDMPEYLGGTSRDMQVNQVTQTTENDNGVLGDYAGQAYINGNSDHQINFQADEEGFIIGLLTIMPSANYSQAIPKFWLRQNALDYFSPEFGKIGYQPLLNREIDPIGSFYDGTGDKIFGYQRPWYDYISTFDTLHGKFRTEFQNFVLTRQFDTTPTLSENFLVFDPEQLNNIFYVDDDEDKILGQILFEYDCKIPVPLYGVPALE